MASLVGVGKTGIRISVVMVVLVDRHCVTVAEYPISKVPMQTLANLAIYSGDGKIQLRIGSEHPTHVLQAVLETCGM